MDLIEKYPVIYDYDHPNYGEMDAYNNSWSEISFQMNIDGLF